MPKKRTPSETWKINIRPIVWNRIIGNVYVVKRSFIK